MARDAEKLAAQAERLRELKAQARGVTFANIAEATKTTERQVQRWFAGDSDIGSDNLRLLARYFGTSMDYIEYGRERPAKTPDLAKADQSQLDRIEAKLDELLARGVTRRDGDPAALTPPDAIRRQPSGGPSTQESDRPGGSSAGADRPADAV